MTAQVVGLTGSQHGMNLLQERAVGQLLVDLAAESLHHGDCVGADAQAHAIAKSMGLHVVGHPPVNESRRAFTDCDAWRDPLPYLDRNHAIVDEVEALLATPQTMREVLRSGTWATVRYARAAQRELFVVFPNGSVWHENAAAPPALGLAEPVDGG